MWSTRTNAQAQLLLTAHPKRSHRSVPWCLRAPCLHLAQVGYLFRELRFHVLFIVFFVAYIMLQSDVHIRNETEASGPRYYAPRSEATDERLLLAALAGCWLAAAL